MDGQDKSEPQTAPRNAGEQLRAAREAAGLSRADVAAKTRVAERHLIAIEENRFSELAAPTYAVGFARAYARAVNLDEADIAKKVRRQLDAQSHVRPEPEARFEPGDPARVPSSRLAWIAGLLVIVAVALLLVFWNSFISPEGKLPDLVPEAESSVAAPATPEPTMLAEPAAPAATTGPVVLTATGPRVWVKITDAAGNQVFQKEMAQGESFTVPPEAQEPALRLARPDQLQITVGGRALPLLADGPKVMSGILLTPKALLERAGVSGAASTPGRAPSVAPSPAAGAGETATLPVTPKMDDILGTTR